MQELQHKFSRGAASVFSEVWRDQLKGGGGAIVIHEKSRPGNYLEPYKRILAWIDLCVEEGNDIKFPEVIISLDPHPTPISPS